MPAFLLSSAPGSNASQPGISLLAKAPESAKGSSQAIEKTGSFFESLSASMASLTKVGQDDAADIKVDLEKLSASLEELSEQLEELDPALFEALRGFLNGQDLSPQALKKMQAGGDLPDFFASLKANLSLETQLDTLTELELSAIDSSMAQISELIQQQADPASLDAKDSDVLPGFAFTIDKDGRVQLVNTGATTNAPGQQSSAGSSVSSQALSAQTIQPASTATTLQNPLDANGSQPSQTSFATNTTPIDQALNGASAALSESDKSFNAHLEQLKSDIPADVADALLDAGQEVKDKVGLSRFSDSQYKIVSEPFKPYSTTLMTPVDAKEWADEVSQKIVWFTGRNIQAAEMHLNPADLGPIDVKINVQNDVASVSFNVQNSSVRELLESNVVRLREMMESNGVNLGDVNVDSGTRDAYQEAQQSGQQHASKGGAGNEEFLEDEMKIETVSVKNSNLVDYFV